MASTCPLEYQTTMYTKNQVCELLRKHGVHVNDVDKSLDMVEQLKKTKYGASTQVYAIQA